MAYSRSIKTRISTSIALLPVAIGVGIVLRVLWFDYSLQPWISLAVVLGSTLLLRHFSNEAQLIRIRSWIVSSLYIVLTALCAPLHHWDLLTISCSFLYLVYIIALLTSYQAQRPQNQIFVASLALSLISVKMPMALWLLVPMVLAMLTTLRSFTARTFLAMIFGVLVPYEFLFAWHLYNHNVMEAWADFSTWMQDFCLPISEGGLLADYDSWQEWALGRKTPMMVVLLVYGLIGIVHFFHTSINDKTSTRMFYISLIMQWPVVAGLLMFSRGNDALLCAMLVLINSILVGHYFVFSKGWVANMFFWLFLILCLYSVLPRP